jgi:DNA-3-methyladenine glycosylase I
MNNAWIVRNRLKIQATIINAQKFLEIQKQFWSLDTYIRQFTWWKTIINKRDELKQLPAKSPESDAMSKDLLKHGFKFVGSTICYAFMQAAWMINDHLITCHCYKNNLNS